MAQNYICLDFPCQHEGAHRLVKLDDRFIPANKPGKPTVIHKVK